MHRRYAHATLITVLALSVTYGVVRAKPNDTVFLVNLDTAITGATTEMMEDAAKMYESSAEGLALRWMNILYEIGQQPGTNTMILVPSNMPQAGVAPVGLYGVQELAKQTKEKQRDKPE